MQAGGKHLEKDLVVNQVALHGRDEAGGRGPVEGRTCGDAFGIVGRVGHGAQHGAEGAAAATHPSDVVAGVAGLVGAETLERVVPAVDAVRVLEHLLHEDVAGAIIGVGRIAGAIGIERRIQRHAEDRFAVRDGRQIERQDSVMVTGCRDATDQVGRAGLRVTRQGIGTNPIVVCRIQVDHLDRGTSNEIGRADDEDAVVVDAALDDAVELDGRAA